MRIIWNAILVAGLVLSGYAFTAPLAAQSPPTDSANLIAPRLPSEGFVGTPSEARLPDTPEPQVAISRAEPWVSSAGFDVPQTVHQKFMSYAIGTFGPRALVLPMFPAGYQMAWPPRHFPRDWSDGAEAVGRNYGDQFAEVTTRQTARFATAALLHEDMRYEPSGLASPLGRTLHALTYTFLNRSDNGDRELAWDNFVGAAAGGYVGRLYLPTGFNDMSHANTRMAFQFGFLAVGNVTHEFAPELDRFSQKIHFKLLREIPEWWSTGAGDGQ